MSALPVYELACDAPACEARFVGHERLAKKTRALAAVAGWRHVLVPIPHHGGPAPSVDLCPDHAHVDARTCLARSAGRKVRV